MRWIEFIDLDGGTPILVNLDQVREIYDCTPRVAGMGPRCTIMCVDGADITVKAEYETVRRLLVARKVASE